mmetsp:Transcript_65340/g.188210  ORF Transcript_65340/g.188210 Transcript_65340/m.188210 type:complete len:221 (-) Transcript_65340:2420-3082(-)
MPPRGFTSAPPLRRRSGLPRPRQRKSPAISAGRRLPALPRCPLSARRGMIGSGRWLGGRRPPTLPGRCPLKPVRAQRPSWRIRTMRTLLQFGRLWPLHLGAICQCRRQRPLVMRIAPRPRQSPPYLRRRCLGTAGRTAAATAVAMARADAGASRAGWAWLATRRPARAIATATGVACWGSACATWTGTDQIAPSGVALTIALALATASRAFASVPQASAG